MRRFWDARAREHALYYIDNHVDYFAPDAERFWAGGEETVELLRSELGVEPAAGERVVEIGCGVGRMTRALAGRATEVVALDVSGEMIDRARELNPQLANVRWLVGDGASLAGVDDGSADAVVSFVVFQHIPDPEVTLAYVREMGRVLRAGGWAAFQVSTDPAAHVRRRGRAPLRWRLLQLARRAPRGERKAAWLGAPTDLQRLRATAAAAGLTTELVTGEGTQFCFVLLRREGA
jgi:SAM-dependent methyltransferase